MITIRQYQDEDRAAVWALHNAALFPTGAHVGNGPWDDDLHRIQDVYIKAGGEFLVGLLGAVIVAMGALKRLSPDCAEVKRMRVDPEHQRKGFGQAVLNRLERRADELGYRHLCLDTTTKQDAAQQLYRKNGYRETGRKQMGRFEVILSEKDLGEPSHAADMEPVG